MASTIDFKVIDDPKTFVTCEIAPAVRVGIGRELGLGSAQKVIEAIKEGRAHYDLVEVMACRGGCISGAGQPYISQRHRVKRSDGLYRSDRVSLIKRSQDNPLMKELYGTVLKGREHELLHVHYTPKA